MDGWRLAGVLFWMWAFVGCENAPPGAPVGDRFERSCAAAWECPGKKCIHLQTNTQGLSGLCSKTCRASEECGEGAICFALGRAGSACLARCQASASCGEGLACTPVGIFGETACFVEPVMAGRPAGGLR